MYASCKWSGVATLISEAMAVLWDGHTTSIQYILFLVELGDIPIFS